MFETIGAGVVNDDVHEFTNGNSFLPPLVFCIGGWKIPVNGLKEIEQHPDADDQMSSLRRGFGRVLSFRSMGGLS